MTRSSRHLILSALLLSSLAGCARAQNGQLEAENPQPQPEAPVEAPPVAPAPLRNTVWREGQSGLLKLSGPLANFRGALSIRDFAGKVVWNGQAATGAQTVALPVSSAGFYTLEAGAQKLNFAVVPQPSQAQVAGRTLFGVNTHFGPRDAPDEAFQLLQNVGVDAVRDEIGWAPSEKQPGVFQFLPRHEAYTAKLKQHGIPLHWSASYGNPLYPRVAGRYPAREAAPQYARYVVEVLKKFGDNIIAVEVLNEPNKVPPIRDYLPVLRATHEAVRAAGFKQPIVSIGGAGPDGGGMAPGYARTVFGAGGSKFTEGFSQHPYMTPFTPDIGYTPANGLANLDAALARGAKVVEQFGLGGNYVTELGWPGIQADQNPTPEEWAKPNGARPMVSELKQAAFTARMLLIASKYPQLKALYVYDFQDDGPLPLRREHRFGLVRQDLQPKMALQAFAVAKNFLRDKTFVKSFQSPASLLSANLYRDGNGELWLSAWTLETTQQEALDVIARKQTDKTASLSRRHMENENHVRFRVKGAATPSGTDWQGAPLSGTELKVTSLPMYVRVGRDEGAVELETLGVEKVKDGMAGFPAKEVDALIAAQNAG